MKHAPLLLLLLCLGCKPMTVHYTDPPKIEVHVHFEDNRSTNTYVVTNYNGVYINAGTNVHLTVQTSNIIMNAVGDAVHME